MSSSELQLQQQQDPSDSVDSEEGTMREGNNVEEQPQDPYIVVDEEEGTREAENVEQQQQQEPNILADVEEEATEEHEGNPKKNQQDPSDEEDRKPLVLEEGKPKENHSSANNDNKTLPAAPPNNIDDIDVESSPVAPPSNDDEAEEGRKPGLDLQEGKTEENHTSASKNNDKTLSAAPTNGIDNINVGTSPAAPSDNDEVEEDCERPILTHNNNDNNIDYDKTPHAAPPNDDGDEAKDHKLPTRNGINTSPAITTNDNGDGKEGHRLPAHDVIDSPSEATRNDDNEEEDRKLPARNTVAITATAGAALPDYKDQMRNNYCTVGPLFPPHEMMVEAAEGIIVVEEETDTDVVDVAIATLVPQAAAVIQTLSPGGRNIDGQDVNAKNMARQQITVNAKNTVGAMVAPNVGMATSEESAPAANMAPLDGQNINAKNTVGTMVALNARMAADEAAVASAMMENSRPQ